MNKHAAQSQAMHVSDTTFAREMWRHTERGNVEAAMLVRSQWKHSKAAEGYDRLTGPLTPHEIGAFADKHQHDAGVDLMGFARAIERAALIRAYTLLPELRQAEESKHHRRYFRDGLEWGLAIYSGAIRTLAMGQTPLDAKWDVPAQPGTPRNSTEITKLERTAGTEDVRPRFEAWAGQRQFDLRRQDGSDVNMVTAYAWMGWLGAHADKEAGGTHGQA